MKFVNSNAALIEQSDGITEMLKHIEKAGRVSYQSTDSIKKDSYGRFINMLKERGHLSPLEHGSVYLTIPTLSEYTVYSQFKSNPYTNVVTTVNTAYITTNYRVIVENNLEESLKYWERTENHIPRVTFDIVCSRGVSHELVRHRMFSFTQESTRYCNYSKDKYDSSIKYIIPSWSKTLHEGDEFDINDVSPEKAVEMSLNKTYENKTIMLIAQCVGAEQTYLHMLDAANATPQEAREVLPNALKTEIMMTGTVPQWEQFLKLRSPKCGAKGVHPDMAVIADKIYEQLKITGYIKKEVVQSDDQKN